MIDQSTSQSAAPTATTARGGVAAAVVACLALSAGCGEGKFLYAPVAGSVQINGKPVEGVRVLFKPRSKSDSSEAGVASFAVTDAEGRFKLVRFDGEPGAVVGDHRVVFNMYRKSKSGKLMMQEGLPSRFNSASSVSFEVPSAGTQGADFELEAKEVRLESLWQSADGDSSSKVDSEFGE